ncbi:hypothetical protein ACKKBG_A20225 [Auxenochlorella protothecoides x Auxenochlorella symbiontica]
MVPAPFLATSGACLDGMSHASHLRGAVSAFAAAASLSHDSPPMALSVTGALAPPPRTHARTDYGMARLTIPATCLAAAKPRRRRGDGGGGPGDGGSGWGGGGGDDDDGQAAWQDDSRPWSMNLAVLWTLLCAYAVAHSTLYLTSTCASALVQLNDRWKVERQLARSAGLG